MIALIQRVKEASVHVDGAKVASINKGLLVLLGVEKGDSTKSANRLVDKMLGYRVFPDDQGRMNLSLRHVLGDILIVPQFTLVANTQRGTRPSFSSGADPQTGKKLFEHVLSIVQNSGLNMGSGVFGADMQVGLTNDGPVTFWLQVSPDTEA